MSKKQLQVVLLYGGKSGEHEISLISAASVLAELDATRYQITPVGMDKEGKLYVNDYQELLGYPDALPISTARSRRLDSLICDGKLAIPADVVFPIAHGPLYEDGALQGVLELAGIAYVGCDVLSSAIGMNKDISRRLLRLEGIQSTRYRVLSWDTHAPDFKSICDQASEAFGWPLFVKPGSLGSSVGTHKVKNREELLAAVDDARRYDNTVLIEEFMQGREIELAVLENSSPSLPPK